MVTVLLISLLFGAVLGQRFRVFIVLPAILPAVVFATIVAASQGMTARQILATAVIAVTSLQIGYLAGVAIRHFLAAERASRLRPRQLAISASNTVSVPITGQRSRTRFDPFR
jgi:predicted permease